MTAQPGTCPHPPASDVPAGGTDWNRVAVARVVDGDTVRLHRQRATAELLHRDDLGLLTVSEWRLRVVEDDDRVAGVAARLVNLDTPERGQPGHREAADDLAAWCAEHAGVIRCVTYDTGGGFDRLLVDLYVMGAGGRESATEHMLRRGWAPYVAS